MNNPRLFSLARFVCAASILVVAGLPAESASPTAGTKSSVQRVPGTQRLTLKKRTVAPARTTSAAARARTSTKARQPQDAGTPRFKFDESGALMPDIRAEAWIIYDPKTDKVLWEMNSTNQRSIASITKVMTATVILDDPDLDLNAPVVVASSDVRAASTTYLRAGYTVTKDDLLHLLLIGSDNAAARALARTSPYGSEGFVRRMNEKAEELGLESTSYVDPSGLFNANVSSAFDLAKLISFVSGNERIASIMRSKEYKMSLGRRGITVSSTNRLVKAGDVNVQAGKTGFIRSSGYCLATLLRLQGGSDVAVVVLGAKSNAARFSETRNLLSWATNKVENLLGSTVEAATPTATQN